jgi:hypothetical protein
MPMTLARKIAANRTEVRTRIRRALYELSQACEGLGQPDQLYRRLAAASEAAEQGVQRAAFLLEYEMPDMAREIAEWSGGALFPLDRCHYHSRPRKTGDAADAAPDILPPLRVRKRAARAAGPEQG